MEKTITNEDFEKVREEFKTNGQCLRDAFKAAGITVGPPPILDGCTGGDWFVEEVHESSYKVMASDCAPLAKNIRHPADAKAMAGGKKLAELLVAYHRWDEQKYPHMCEKKKEYIDQLAKMGADMTEFGRPEEGEDE